MTKSRGSPKQNGNMFIGLVLGLITGLAIAIAVALYITRSPSPITPKNPTPESPTPLDASPPFNPNRPLQGDRPAEPAPQAPPASTASDALSEQGQNQSQDGLPQAPSDETQIIEVPPTASEHASERMPQTDKPATSNAVSPASRPKTPDAPVADINTGYYLQAGAYKTRADAEAQRAQIALQGFEAKVSQHDSGNITYYRVRIGPLTQFDQMNSVRRQLSDAGIGTVVIRFRKE